MAQGEALPEVEHLWQPGDLMEDFRQATSSLLKAFETERRRYLDIQRATINLLEDVEDERTKFARTQLATMNMIEDMDQERRRYQQIQKATVNLLEDMEGEKVRFARTQEATMNMLEDMDQERRKYHQIQKATVNLLEDMDEERARLDQSQRAVMNMAEDFEEERTRAEQAKGMLEAVNKELEAFSYSVSHDLRAPLRAISGFSDAIVEDYAARLDEEGKRYLGFIRENAHKMGQLIDDLLSFSRLGRQEMTATEIDIEALAGEVFDDIAAQAPGRNIEFTVHPMPPARGDRALLKQVLMNLLSNAVKFTRHRKRALIQVGYSPQVDGGAYYVKDNGVGFDMKYAPKLFGVFQRLHADAEFEGTGVGLAIVNRIILRHGGRVWAEAEVDKGATFYFTLPVGEP
ncbi:MAG: sensor histidine kinase [Candidatus Aquicultorales bacterium]